MIINLKGTTWLDNQFNNNDIIKFNEQKYETYKLIEKVKSLPYNNDVTKALCSCPVIDIELQISK